MKVFECEHCGKKFEYKGKAYAHYCDECRLLLTGPDSRRTRMREWRSKKRQQAVDYRRLVTVDGRTLDHLDATLLRCKELGLTYAQYQVEQTLALVPPIGTDELH